MIHNNDDDNNKRREEGWAIIIYGDSEKEMNFHLTIRGIKTMVYKSGEREEAEKNDGKK